MSPKTETQDTKVSKPQTAFEAWVLIFIALAFFLTEKTWWTLAISGLCVGIIILAGVQLNIDEFTRVRVAEVTGQKIETVDPSFNDERESQEAQYILVAFEDEQKNPYLIVVEGYAYGETYDPNYAAFVLAGGRGVFIVDRRTHRGYPLEMDIHGSLKAAGKK